MEIIQKLRELQEKYGHLNTSEFKTDIDEIIDLVTDTQLGIIDDLSMIDGK